MNYNGSAVGVPYVRSHRIVINYPPSPAMPNAVIEQTLAVKLADGSVVKLGDLATINVTMDMVNDGNVPIPLVSPDTGEPLGANTTLTNTMLSILAVVRSKQIQPV